MSSATKRVTKATQLCEEWHFSSYLNCRPDCKHTTVAQHPICHLLLRSRPTCHGIRRTVIDTARESLVFRFFCIILRLDPCRTGPLPPHLPSPTSSCLIGLMPRTPITCTASRTA